MVSPTPPIPEAWESMLPAAEAFVAKYLGIPLVATAFEEEVRGGSAILRLEHGPIISITEIVSADSEDPVDELTYRIVPGNSGHVRRQYFTWPPMQFRVSYSAGFDTVPDDVAAAINAIARDLYAQTQSDGRAMQSESLGDYSYSRAAATDAFASFHAILDLHRRIG